MLAAHAALTVIKIINDKATLTPNTADKHKVHQLTSSLAKTSQRVTDDFTEVKSKHKIRKTLNHRKREKKYEQLCREHGGVLIVSLLTQILRCHNWRDQNIKKNELTLSIMPLYCLIKESNMNEAFKYIERVNRTSTERKKTDNLSQPKSSPLKRNEKKHRPLYTDMVLFCKTMASVIRTEASPKSVAQLDQKRSTVELPQTFCRQLSTVLKI